MNEIIKTLRVIVNLSWKFFGKIEQFNLFTGINFSKKHMTFLKRFQWQKDVIFIIDSVPLMWDK